MCFQNVSKHSIVNIVFVKKGLKHSIFIKDQEVQDNTAAPVFLSAAWEDFPGGQDRSR